MHMIVKESLRRMEAAVVDNKKGMGAIEMLLIIAAVVAVALLFRTQVVAAATAFLSAFSTWMSNQSSTTFGS